MPPTRLLFAVLLLGPAVPAAGQSPPVADHRTKGDLAVRARGVLLRYCGECHTDKARNPMGRLRVDDHAALIGHRTPVPFVADGGQLVALIDDGSMPPGNHPRPNEQEVKLLREWARESPAYPKAFDDSYATAAVIRDFPSVGKDQPFVRYVSFAHLLDAPADAKTDWNDLLRKLATAETNLRAALGDEPADPKPERLRPVDPAGTVFRFDLRHHGWEHDGLFRVGSNDDFHMIPFDLVMLENPYTVPPGQLAGENEAAAVVKKMNAHHGESLRLKEDAKRWGRFRPPLFLRGDWLADALRSADGKPTPLAADLASLVELKSKPESEYRETQAPKQTPFTIQTPVKSAHPPLGSWAVRDVAATNEPLTLTVKTIPPEPVRLALNESFEFSVTPGPDKDGRLALIEITPGGQVNDKTEKLLDKVAAKGVPTAVAINSQKTFLVSEPGTFHYVLFVAEQPPALTVVTSRHAPKHAVRRFFPADPDAVAVRKVVTVEVR